MDNEELQQIISEPNNVTTIINVLNDYFKYLYLKYSKQSFENTKQNANFNKFNTFYDAEAYYLNGHCMSYANILCEIFGEYCVKYNNDEHIIVKICEHYYDVRGLIDGVKYNKSYHKTSMEDLYYMDIFFNQNNDFEKTIENELITFGKKELDNLIQKAKNCKIYTKNK